MAHEFRSKIDSFIKDNAFQKGGVSLLSKNNSILLIRICAEENVKILGIDGFLLIQDKIQPSLENSIDFTASYAKKDNIYEQALNFVNPIDDKYYFEVVYK
jgi:hypothetical protein